MQQTKNKLEQAVELKRQIGLYDGTALIVGVIIGTGIFVSPQDVLRQSGSEGAAIVIWALSGLLSLFGALSFAELGTSIADSGGDYSYIHLAYGPLPAFLYLWECVFISLPCSNAVAALAFAKYLIKMIVALGIDFLTTTTTTMTTTNSFLANGINKRMQEECFNESNYDNATRLLAFAILLLLIYINCRSVKCSIRLQSCFTFAKFFAFAFIIFVGFYYIVSGPSETEPKSSKSYFDDTNENWSSLALAFYSAIYTFSGW